MNRIAFVIVTLAIFFGGQWGYQNLPNQGKTEIQRFIGNISLRNLEAFELPSGVTVDFSQLSSLLSSDSSLVVQDEKARNIDASLNCLIVESDSGVSINFRSSPQIGDNVFNSLLSDTVVELIEQTGDWYHVRYGEFTGYVHSDVATPTNCQ